MPRAMVPNFLMPGTGFMENSFSTDRYKIGGMGRGWFGDDLGHSGWSGPWCL